MKQITLEDHLLNAMASLTKRDMKALIENLEIDLSEKFRGSDGAFQTIDLVKNTIARYGAVYGSMKTKFNNMRTQNSRQEDEFLRLYWTYISSEGCLSFLRNGDEHQSMIYALERTPVNFSLTLDSTDQSTLSDALSNYSRFILNSSSPNHIKRDSVKYFEFLSRYAVGKMDNPLLAEHLEMYKDSVVIGKNFKVDGIKKPKAQLPGRRQAAEGQDSNFKKGLEEITLKPVKKEEIVGNKEGIELIETEIPCLLHYDPNEKRNPFFGFRQYILFAGKSGTGKTMLARYAMTLAGDIAEKNKKQLAMVKLNFEDRWQCGPLENIRDQLTEISEGNRIYIVFVDEIDTKIPSRTGGAREGYKNDVVGEFLRFRGEGDYINRGNYILIGTTNEPKKLDPAILSVFGIEELSGPVTAAEKVQVLYNSLTKGISQGYVKIKDWETIGKLLLEYGMTGRDIVNVAYCAEVKHRRIALRVPYPPSASEKERMVCTILSRDGSEYITRDEDIIKSIAEQSEKSAKEKKSYLVEAGG